MQAQTVRTSVLRYVRVLTNTSHSLPSYNWLQRAALENMSKILQASGSDLQHVVKVNAYLTSMQRDFGPMNEVYLEVGFTH